MLDLLTKIEKIPVPKVPNPHNPSHILVTGHSVCVIAATVVTAILNVLLKYKVDHHDRRATSVALRRYIVSLVKTAILRGWFHSTTQNREMSAPQRSFYSLWNTASVAIDDALFETTTVHTTIPIEELILHINVFMQKSGFITDTPLTSDTQWYLKPLELVSCGTVSSLIGPMLADVICAMRNAVSSHDCPEWNALMSMLAITFTHTARDPTPWTNKQLFPLLSAAEPVTKHETMVTKYESASLRDSKRTDDMRKVAIDNAMDNADLDDAERNSVSVISTIVLKPKVEELNALLADAMPPLRLKRMIWIFEHGRHLIMTWVLLIVIVILVGIVSNIMVTTIESGIRKFG